MKANQSVWIGRLELVQLVLVLVKFKFVVIKGYQISYKYGLCDCDYHFKSLFYYFSTHVCLFVDLILLFYYFLFVAFIYLMFFFFGDFNSMNDSNSNV